jgi:hypothetical protein
MENNSLANECNWPRAWWALAILSLAALIYIYSQVQ